MNKGKDDGELQPGRLAIRLQKIFTAIYHNAMDSIEPKDKRDPNFKEKHDAWDKAFRFTNELKIYVDKLSSMVSDAGQTHNSDGNITVTTDFVIKLRNVLNSDEFRKNMKTAEPDTNDPRLKKIWYNAFVFPGKLERFAGSIEYVLNNSGGKMPFYTFLSMLKAFLTGVEDVLGLPHT